MNRLFRRPFRNHSHRFSRSACPSVLGLVVAAVVLTGPLATHAQPVPHAHAPKAAAAKPSPAKAAMTHVETDKVCMVNDQYFGTPQIPVEVEGRTYYGCCEGCKATLAGDARARTAVDPVSGKTVDKAVAYIGAAADRRVLYFENAANLKAWNRR